MYDLAIPGDLRVNIEYLGSVSADYDMAHYIFLTPDPKTPVSPFPALKRDPPVLSSTVRTADAVWFKFRITNTGDTILGPEGFASTCAWPQITCLDLSGKPKWTAGTENVYERQLNYIYPGESVEQWINSLHASAHPVAGPRPHRRRLPHRFRDALPLLPALRLGHQHLARQGFRPGLGSDPVREDRRAVPVHTSMEITDTSEKMPGYFEAFEQFMTSFAIFPPLAAPAENSGTIHLQVAPWTHHVTLKLILTDPKRIAVARIPVAVGQETLDIACNPRNVMVVSDHGVEEPAIVAQALPGMRTNFQLGPYPEDHMLAEIREMKDLGVNLIANTCGNWWIPEIMGRKIYDSDAEGYKYWYDVLVRRVGIKTIGRSIYPPSHPAWYDYAAPLLGRKVVYRTVRATYQDRPGVDMGDPAVPEVIAAWAVYCYRRWGDTWFTTKDGRMPITIEDTWGWMRDDVNERYTAGPLAVARFRTWLQARYGNIDRLNAVWNSRFKDFATIDPEARGPGEPDDLGTREFYSRTDPVFHEWAPAMEDWDRFRTLLRMEIYRKANEIIRKTIPTAELALQSEGANLAIAGDAASPEMHCRHAYYAQRRNAMVTDVVRQENILHFLGDYTTLPYSSDQWRRAVREMAAAGFVPTYLPQFNDMRDIVLNPHYGRDYRVSYNLDRPQQGMLVHCLMAAYPWWKIAYEEGSAPAMSWADYECDAFITETQKREIKLLREHFRKMKPVGSGKGQGIRD